MTSLLVLAQPPCCCVTQRYMLFLLRVHGFYSVSLQIDRLFDWKAFDGFYSVSLQIDRLFDWKAQTDAPIQQSLNSQKDHVKREFDERLKQSVLNLNEQGLNVALYWENPDKRKYVNVVPTSAITGEGLPDMLQLLVDLTQVRVGMSYPLLDTAIMHGN